jgi:HSP20 family molecular chaperone IbpA
MSTERDYGWMWLQAVELVEQAERLQRRFLRYLGPEGGAVNWEPPVDILETEAGLLLRFALPGVAPEDIEIRLDGAELTVSASRRLCSAPSALIRRLEIPHGRFVRRIVLAGPALRIAESECRHGCLELRLVARESGA